MRITDVLKAHERAVVIVRYRPSETVAEEVYRHSPPPQNPACFLQVTLVSTRISPSGKLIRLGDTRGDEIMGWTHIDALEVIEVLGELSQDNQTVVPDAPRESLEFSSALDRRTS